jgi:hypothetical protein
LHLGDAPRIDGSIETEGLDAAAVLAAAIGMPARHTAGGSGWSSEPVAWSPTGLNGRIDFKAQRAVLASWLVAERVHGTARFNGSEVVFDDVGGELGNGRLEGRLSVSNGADGLAARLRVGLADGDLSAIFPGGDRPATAGRLGLTAELEGAGRSPAAFIGSLAGFGTVTLEKAKLVGLNPQVFGAVTGALELGIPTEGARLRDFVVGALDNSALSVAKASAAISINAGQARLRDIAIRADGADLQATVNVDLSDAMLDALLTLNAPPSAPGAVHPAVLVALKGILPSPKRTVDIDPLTSWLTLRAVDLQSKQIDAMEKLAREQAAREAAAAAAAAAAVPPPKPADAPAAGPEKPASPAPHATNGTVNGSQAPLYPPPIIVPETTKPRAAPRPDSAAPARTTAQPPNLFGAQN